MTEDRSKTPRTLLVADHLWDTLGAMAAEMGSDRDALINQALYTFARLNGFLVAADLKRLAGDPLHAPAAAPAPAATQPASEKRSSSGPKRPPPGSPPPTMMMMPEERASLRPPANAERVAELAQQLQVSTPARGAPSSPPPVKDPGSIEVDDSLLGDEGRQATSMDLPNLSDPGSGAKKPAAPMAAPNRTLSDIPEPPELTPVPGQGTGRTLILTADGRELDRVVKERFLIGRGKHCDLIINSGKVSREHAAITREGSDYFMEDLGSSNGTWHDKRRITRRQIQEGDEYFICAEKLSCTFR